MTTPTGRIQMSDVNAELGRAWNNNSDMNDVVLRTLAGANTATWTRMEMNWLRGKSRVVASPLTADIDSVEYYGDANTTAFTRTDYLNVYPAGGSGGYTYQWSILNGAGTLYEATSSRARITHYIPRFGTQYNTNVRCVVSDSAGNTVTKDTYISLNYGFY